MDRSGVSQPLWVRWVLLALWRPTSLHIERSWKRARMIVLAGRSSRFLVSRWTADPNSVPRLFLRSFAIESGEPIGGPRGRSGVNMRMSDLPRFSWLANG